MLLLESLITQGDEAIERGAFDEALQFFRRAHNFSPDSIEPFRAMVRLALAEGRIREALSLAQELIAERPKDGRSYLSLAVVLRAQGDDQRARKALRTAGRFQTFDVNTERAGLFFELGDWRECLAACKAALVVNPSDATVNTIAAEACLELGENYGAWEYSSTAFHADPLNSKMYLLLSRVHLANENLYGADTILVKAIQRFGETSELLQARARVAVVTGCADLATEFLLRASQLEVCSDGVGHELSALLLAQEQYAVAGEVATRLLECAPRDAAALLLLGRALHGMGFLDEAVTALRRAATRDAGNWKIQFELGRIFERRDSRRAARYFDRAVCLAPEHQRALPRAHLSAALRSIVDTVAGDSLAA